jgi:hypothetical protein
MKDYFLVYFDEEGLLHVGPKNNIESMALKHLQHQVDEKGMDKVIVIDTEVAISLGQS